MRKGFTLVEILVVVAIIATLAAIGIPLFYGAYGTAKQNVRARNLMDVEKAKRTLTLPANIVQGAMGLKDESQDLSSGEAGSNLLKVLNIKNLSALTVGDQTIQIGTLKEPARYE